MLFRSVGLSGQSARNEAGSRRWNDKARAEQRRRLHVDAIARPLHAAGLASGQPPADARRRRPRQQARPVRLRLLSFAERSRPSGKLQPCGPSRFLHRATVADFKSGARRSSEPASLPINFMVAVAKLVSEEDAKIAAEYFASLDRKSTRLNSSHERLSRMPSSA